MSRLTSQPGVRSTTLITAGLMAAVVAQPAPATADVVAPVTRIVAPVLDIQFDESDLEGSARVERLPARTTVTLDSNILFGKDSAQVNTAAATRLAAVAQQLGSRGPGRVSITGHTDDLGSAAHGRELSQQRADAVARVLRRGLPAGDFPFTTAGRGEDDPAVPNTSESNRRINRRVVVVYRQR